MALFSVFHGAMNSLSYTSIGAWQPSPSSLLLRGMHVTPSSKASCISAASQRKSHIITITATMPIELGAAAARTVEEKESHVPRPLLHERASHSMSAEKVELFKSLDGWVETNILPILTSVEKSWQPQDFLPEPSSDGFCNELRELKARSIELPDDYLVCLVGDMITEEALPTYQLKVNRADGMRDETGARLTAWARWTRAWTAEENRHGDLLNKYLYLTGRVDMRAIEKTIQYLIERGMDPQTGNSPYLAAIYTSFQERATVVSHGNTARQANQFGDTKLAQICGAIAADERRHENAYTRIVEKLFEVDTECTMLALEEMMRKKIGMPARLMYDGHSKHIFDEFCRVAQKTGVYTVKDNADILEHLMKRWNVEKLEGLSSRGQEAQEYVCNLANRMRRVGDIAWKVKRKPKSVTFSWIFNREVALH